MDVKKYREIRNNIRRKRKEAENKPLKEQIKPKNKTDSYVKSHQEQYNTLPIEENKQSDQRHIISIPTRKFDKSINLQINIRNYPYLLLFKEIKKLGDQTIDSMRKLRSTASDLLFLEFIDNAIGFASSLLNSTTYLDSIELNKLTIDLEAKIESEHPGTIEYKNEIPKIRKIIYNHVLNQINKHISDYNLIPLLFFSNEDANYFLHARDTFSQFEHVSPGMLGIPEIELLRSVISTYGVSDMEEWNSLVNNYFNKKREEAIIKFKEISKSSWFMAYTSLVLNNIDGFSSIFANSFTKDLEEDITKLLRTNAYPFLFERETILQVAESPLGLSNEFNFFLLLSEIYERSKYPGYDIASGRIRSQIVGFLDHINLISDRRFMVIPVVTGPPSEFYDAKKTQLFIVTTHIKDNVASQLLLSDKNVAIILLPPSLFGFNIQGQRNVVKILINTPYLQYDKSLSALQNNINLICPEVKCEVITPIYDYMVKNNNEYMTLMEIWLKHTTKESIDIKQIPKHIDMPQNNNSAPLHIEDFSFVSDFINSMKGIVNLIYVNSGTTVIVYDENKKGIEDSLTSLATEIASIQGNEFNPIAIKSLTEFQKYTISELGKDTGIFVVGHDVCGNMDNDIDKTVKESLDGIIGNKYSIIIVPNCFYIHYLPILEQKASRIVKENIDDKLISTLAFAASGLCLKENGYSSLAAHKKYIEGILTASRQWLRENHINLDKPNNGPESDIHRNLKALGILYLIKNCSIDPSIIKIENQFDDAGALKPDIFVGTEIIIDAKSSIGVIPGDEVHETIKYSIFQEQQISVIMRPLPVLLDIVGVAGWLNYLNDNGINFNVLLPVNEDSPETELPQLIEIGDYLRKVDKYYKDIKNSDVR